MRTILYIGDVITAGNLQRESKKYKVEILPFHAANSTSKEIADVIYDDSNRYFGVIINIDELTIPVEETQNIIKDILVKTDIAVCLLCAGHTIEEPVIRNLVEIGVQFFMTGVNSIINAKVILNMLKRQSNVATLFSNNEGVLNSSDNKIKTKSITVGGCLPRMGVTTFCIQLIQFLHSIGKKACYVDRTSSNYMDDFIDEMVQLDPLGKGRSPNLVDSCSLAADAHSHYLVVRIDHSVLYVHEQLCCQLGF